MALTVNWPLLSWKLPLPVSVARVPGSNPARFKISVGSVALPANSPYTRVVQVDGRRRIIRNAAGVREKFGVEPRLIPDFLGLVGDAADGYPGIPGIGAVTAARLLNEYGPIERFPPQVLGDNRDLALLFKKLATLRTDAPLFQDVDELRWRGPTTGFATWTQKVGAPRLLDRSRKVMAAQQP